MAKRLRVADHTQLFEPGSDENLVRQTIEGLACHEDVDRWLRRLRIIRELLPAERKQALFEKKLLAESRSESGRAGSGASPLSSWATQV